MRRIKSQKIREYMLFLVGCAVIGVILLTDSNGVRCHKLKAGLFNWDSEVFQETERQKLFETMEELGISILYQSFSKDLTGKQISTFLQQADDHGIEVYLLTGDPSWGEKQGREKMCQEIAYVKKMNETVIQGRIQGILMDTEPYLSEKWEENPGKLMKSYVENMKESYRYAREAELTLIACIPYYYDSWGYEKELEDLIKNGCDEVAVMNYSKWEEAAQIQKEAELASQWGKRLTVIYELQVPGKHGLVENNTYYYQGMEGVQKSLSELVTSCPGKLSQYALHEYKAVREVLERE